MLYWNTVTDRLRDTLIASMGVNEFEHFRLVGGTSLSLQLGHRMSEDIDLFTEAAYGSINFDPIENYFISNYPYVKGDFGLNPGMGKTYRVGDDRFNSVKIDIFYSMEPFFQPMVVKENIRMASVEEIIAMKVDIIQRNGRKKDFWDLHELLKIYTIDEMISLHAARFEWTHEPEVIREQFTNFEQADLDVDPNCLRGKEWEFIKQDFIELLGRNRPIPPISR